MQQPAAPSPLELPGPSTNATAASVLHVITVDSSFLLSQPTLALFAHTTLPPPLLSSLPPSSLPRLLSLPCESRAGADGCEATSHPSYSGACIQSTDCTPAAANSNHVLVIHRSSTSWRHSIQSLVSRLPVVRLVARTHPLIANAIKALHAFGYTDAVRTLSLSRQPPTTRADTPSRRERYWEKYAGVAAG